MNAKLCGGCGCEWEDRAFCCEDCKTVFCDTCIENDICIEKKDELIRICEVCGVNYCGKCVDKDTDLIKVCDNLDYCNHCALLK
jgi:hypothetical protein